MSIFKDLLSGKIFKFSNLSGTNTGDEVSATETNEGIAEIATQSETDTGTDDARIVTSAKVTGWWTNIKTLTQTIAGIWTYTNGLLVGTSTAGKKLTVTASTGYNSQFTDGTQKV